MDASSITVTKPSRSAFIQKLHELLEKPLDASSLSWCGNDSFQITVNEARARHALSAKWEFRSLSSFIRQLSYYNFKRLSDRRRSTERRSSASGYIVFSHPSGFFVQGDNSRLSAITRKTRNRPDKAARRAAKRAKLGLGPESDGEDGHGQDEYDGQDDERSFEGEQNYAHQHNSHAAYYGHASNSPPALGQLQLPPVAWPTHDFRPQALDERKPLPMLHQQWNHQHQHQQQPGVSQWRWSEQQQPQQRRSSIPHIPLGIAPISQGYALDAPRPSLRKAHSAMSIHQSTIHEEGPSHSRQNTGPDSANCGSDRFQSPYPTPNVYNPSPYTTSYFPLHAAPEDGHHQPHYAHEQHTGNPSLGLPPHRRDSSHFVSSGLVGNAALPSPTATSFTASPPNDSIPLPALGGDHLNPRHLDPRALDVNAQRRYSMPQPAYAQYGGQAQPGQAWQPMQLPLRAQEY